MTTRYVILVHADDFSRIFGPYRDRAKADALAEKVNARLVRLEQKHLDAWQAEHDAGSDEMMPNGLGRAVVLRLRPPTIRDAVRFGTGDPS